MRLLRHFVPRNDREIVSLSDLSLRAERSNLISDNAQVTPEYTKRCVVGLFMKTAGHFARFVYGHTLNNACKIITQKS